MGLGYMAEFALILVSTILVNNFVLVQFLGLCPFMGVSGKLETAIGMSAATTFVLTLASILILQRNQDVEICRPSKFQRPTEIGAPKNNSENQKI